MARRITLQSAGWQTCRYCHQGDFRGPWLRYGTRHYTHVGCWLDRGHTLAELPPDTIERLPFLVLKERGLLEQAQKLVEAA